MGVGEKQLLSRFVAPMGYGRSGKITPPFWMGGFVMGSWGRLDSLPELIMTRFHPKWGASAPTISPQKPRATGPTYSETCGRTHGDGNGGGTLQTFDISISTSHAQGKSCCVRKLSLFGFMSLFSGFAHAADPSFARKQQQASKGDNLHAYRVSWRLRLFVLHVDSQKPDITEIEGRG